MKKTEVCIITGSLFCGSKKSQVYQYRSSSAFNTSKNQILNVYIGMHNLSV